MVATIAGEGGAGVAVGAVGLIIGHGIVIGLLSVLGGRWKNEKKSVSQISQNWHQKWSEISLDMHHMIRDQ